MLGLLAPLTNLLGLKFDGSANPRALFFFHAPGCPACQEASPKLAKYAAAHPHLEIYRVDITRFEWGEDWPVQIEATPTYVLHVAGKSVQTRVGALSVRELEKWIG